MIGKENIKSWSTKLFAKPWMFGLGLILVVIGLGIQYYSSIYVDSRGGIAVQDLILNILPSINLSFIFIWLFLFVIVTYFIYALFIDPENGYFYLGAFGLISIFRGISITLTHLAIPANAVIPHYPWVIGSLFYTNDLFFSGHVAYPLLGYLAIKNKQIKIFMLVSTMVLALTVLFMHIHYSIDVFAALFISYGSFKLSKKLFNHNEN